MNLSPEKKIAGILAPLFGLRSENDLGIGDVAVLREFVDWASETGFKLVQLLPINEMGHDNSPYNAISAVAIEPTTLHLAPGSPPDLTGEDFDATLSDVDLANLRRRTERRAHGRHSIRRQLLQRGRFCPPQRIQAGLVRWRTAGIVFQGRRVYPKMGTELGHSAFSLGCDARAEFRLVAPTRPERAAQFPSFSYRSRPRFLPDLCLSLATARKSQLSRARLESDVGTNWWPRAPLRATR